MNAVVEVIDDVRVDYPGTSLWATCEVPTGSKKQLSDRIV